MNTLSLQVFLAKLASIIYSFKSFKMTKKIGLFASLALSLSSSAQSYETLWKQVEANSQKDLPKSALEIVEQIRDKAVAEKNDAQLLRASLMSHVYGNEISPDSGKTYYVQMEAALERETRLVEKALWHSALAQAAPRASYFEEDYDGDQQKVIGHYEASIADREALAKARVKDYLPLFNTGKESSFFNDDLLHVLFRAYQKCGLMNNEAESALSESLSVFYRQQGSEAAALWLDLERERDAYELWTEQFAYKKFEGPIENVPYYQKLRAWATQHADCEANVYTYKALTEMQGDYDEDSEYARHNDSVLVACAEEGIRLYKKRPEAANLQNFITRLSATSARFGSVPKFCYPADSASVELEVRHAKHVELRVTPIYDSTKDFGEATSADIEKRVAANRSKTVVTEYEFADAPDYVWQRKTVDFVAPERPGIYYAEIICDGDTLDHETFHVTTLRLLTLASPKGPRRMVVVDARTGKPVPAATVTAYVRKNWNDWQKQHSYTTDENGTVYVPETEKTSYPVYVPSIAGDAASPELSAGRVYSTYRAYKHTQKNIIDLFTDRAIYRPGQEVAFSGVYYSAEGDDFGVRSKKVVRIELRNANNKTVDTLKVTTDAFGLFHGTFQLPETSLTGSFSLRAKTDVANEVKRFRVEEYKRPTFTAETEPLTAAYALGDSVKVVGTAQTYSGVPVGGAKVTYTVTRHSWFYFDNDEVAPQSGETTTDENGRFVLPVLLAKSHDYERVQGYRRYTYTVNYTVTAEQGETCEGSAAIQVASHRAHFETTLPDVVYRRNGETVEPFKANLLNAANNPLTEEAHYRIISDEKEWASGTFSTDKALEIPVLQTLPTGEYALVLSAADGVMTETKNFRVLDEQARDASVFSTPFFTYSKASEDGRSLEIVIGTNCTDAVVFYDLVSLDSILESRQIPFSSNFEHFKFTYKDLYKDGVKIQFAMVRDGKLYTFVEELKKPEPDKRLLLSWETFRSRLTPGQKEEWTLRVTRPDGTPASASVIAGMYDASLDAFAKNNWAFSGITFPRFMPNVSWNSNCKSVSWALLGTADYKLSATYDAHFTDWQSELFEYGYGNRYRLEEVQFSVASSGVRRMGRANMVAESVMPMAAVTDEIADAESAINGKMAVLDTGASAQEQVTPRSNFAETAFFYPTLHTDGKGETRIAFTLPESMTEWKFAALAHDEQMNYGSLTESVIARKEFMVEPALPRFLRSGDCTDLPVKVTNLSEKTISAKLVLILTDAQTEREVHRAELKVKVAAGASEVFAFPYESGDEATVLVCRATASGDGFSDGEEHYLPVLSTDVEVTRTLPFSWTKKGVYSYEVDTLFYSSNAKHRALTVELSSNPTWYAVTALPVLSGSETSISAPDWATRFYALAIGARIGADNPAIAASLNTNPDDAKKTASIKTEGLTDMTPWLQQAESEKQRAAALKQILDPEVAEARIQKTVQKLKELQKSDGSWSWCPGMPGNNYITVDVSIMLARAEKLSANTAAHSLLTNAFGYLEKVAAQRVKEAKEYEEKYKTKLEPSEWDMRYLYLRTLLGKVADADATYLLDRAEELRKEYTMYGKAVSAIVLAEDGRKEAAELTMKSLLEHTVTKPSMGRWFDTPRAEWSWNSYRIPSQCAAIEALKYFNFTDEMDEMRLWLLQAKRTQMWETSRATTDAVYALLSPVFAVGDGSRVMPLTGEEKLTYSLYDGKKLVGYNAPSQLEAAATLGYCKDAYTDASAVAADALKVSKTQNGLSWGAVYATFTLPAGEVKSDGKGLTLQRRFEVLRGTEWKQVDANETLAKGDRVRQVFTLEADRDYDFVSVNSARAACLQPTEALSGYDWNGGLPAYRAVKDQQTEFYIEQVSKGRHQFAEEYFVDRTGRFATGISKVQCVYSPEFAGSVAETQLSVK